MYELRYRCYFENMKKARILHQLGKGSLETSVVRTHVFTETGTSTTSLRNNPEKIKRHKPITISN